MSLDQRLGDAVADLEERARLAAPRLVGRRRSVRYVVWRSLVGVTGAIGLVFLVWLASGLVEPAPVLDPIPPAGVPSTVPTVEGTGISGTWYLVDGTYQGTEIPQALGRAITLVGANGALTGSAPCGDYRAPAILLDAQEISIGDVSQVLEGCSINAQYAQRPYASALENATSIRMDGGLLVVSGPDAVLRFTPGMWDDLDQAWEGEFPIWPYSSRVQAEAALLDAAAPSGPFDDPEALALAFVTDELGWDSPVVIEAVESDRTTTWEIGAAGRTVKVRTMTVGRRADGTTVYAVASASTDGDVREPRLLRFEQQDDRWILRGELPFDLVDPAGEVFRVVELRSGSESVLGDATTGEFSLFLPALPKEPLILIIKDLIDFKRLDRQPTTVGIHTVVLSPQELARTVERSLFAPLGGPGCAPPSPVIGFESLGTSDTLEAWARLFPTQPDVLFPVGQDTKTVFSLNGEGAFDVEAISSGGLRIPPIPTPSRTAGSNWARPGDEWVVGFNFPSAGCWQIHITRGDDTVDFWFEVG